jgi:signal transduction histidine kinase
MRPGIACARAGAVRFGMLPESARRISFVLLAGVYALAGWLGLQLDAVSGFATLVWAPSGIALAVLLRFGLGLWPGVALGAFAVNVAAGAPIPAAVAIAVGNTLEPVVATILLRRFGFTGVARVRDVMLLLIVAAGFSTIIAATVGTLSLLAAGRVSSDGVAVMWVSWWLGDAIADLIVAPLILSWLTPNRAMTRPQVVEAVILAVVVIATSTIVFARRAPREAVIFLQPYLLIPALIWAAVRFHDRGAATAVFIASTIAVWGTTAGMGPFEAGTLFERLGALQALMASMAITFLLLGAIAAERSRVENELQAAKEAAEEASRAKGRFLAIVSHELRTPLNAVTGYAAIMLEGVTGPMSPQQTTYLERMRAAAWHLTSVIDGILTFARADAGREEVHPENVDVAALTTETAVLLAPLASVKSVGVQTRVPAEPLFMHTDAGKLRQILLNLIGNAVKFSDTGTVTVRVERIGNRVRFDVTDEGPGIPPDRLDDIFEPFTQLSSTNTRGGTGLGLSATRMLAELMGGSVSVVSEVGHGSTFSVSLPDLPPGGSSAIP